MATYVITDPCIDVKDGSCVEVCPVACIHTVPEARQFFIDPEVCIACEQCVIVCPVDAIFLDTEVPERWSDAVDRNARFFTELKPPVEPVSPAQAAAMIAAVEAYAADHGLTLAVAVVDPDGRAVAEREMPGADGPAARDALERARSSAEAKARTPGGRPLVEQLEIIGGLGVAGASAEENGLAARAGAATLGAP